MSRSRQFVEWTANTISIVAGIMLIAALAKGYFTDGPRAEAATIPTGEHVKLADVAWSQYEQTVVVAASVNCHYCSQSSPFYRELIAAAQTQPSRVHTIAVFPESEAEVKAYLATRHLQFGDVRLTPLAQLQVRATPTIILVDRTGVVRASWTGALEAEQEAAVFKTLQLPRAPNARSIPDEATSTANSAAVPGISAEEFLHLSGEEGPLPLVDIRERPLYAKGHVAGALNIPLSELEVRAPHELPKRRPVFVYCRFAPGCESASARDGLLTHCALAQYVLSQGGFADVRFVTGGLRQLAEAGVGVSGSAVEEDD